mmetsp:Transcript_26287/g.75425  ORF Transcript_26287/g.75425 Transcript_26287/m.75425 type:complete len:285 (+) Transcript_26287:299-1153(+)
MTASTAWTAGKVNSLCKGLQKAKSGSSMSSKTRRCGVAASCARSRCKPSLYSARISSLLRSVVDTHRTSSKRSCRNCTKRPSSAMRADFPTPASPCNSTKRRPWTPSRKVTSSRCTSASRPTKSSTRAGKRPQASSASGRGASRGHGAASGVKTSSWTGPPGSRANLRLSARKRRLGLLARAATPHWNACCTLPPRPRATKKWRSKAWQLESRTESSLRTQTTCGTPAAAKCCPNVKEWQELMKTRRIGCPSPRVCPPKRRSRNSPTVNMCAFPWTSSRKTLSD